MVFRIATAKVVFFLLTTKLLDFFLRKKSLLGTRRALTRHLRHARGAFLMHIGIDKREGKQILHAIDAIDAIGAIEQDADGMLVAVFNFQHHLTSGSTRSDRIGQQTFLVLGSDSKHRDGLVGTLRLGGKDGRPFGAQA